jgi:beta-glucosidase
VPLNPGETKTMEFALGPKELAYLSREMQPVVEAGTFEIMAGGNSVELISVNLNVVNR